jgi:hypothetical protein
MPVEAVVGIVIFARLAQAVLVVGATDQVAVPILAAGSMA